jgi:hypothetical protein
MSRTFAQTEVASARSATEAATRVPAHRLRRFAAWLSAQWADDGVSARFAAEREKDHGLVRRVESRRRR